METARLTRKRAEDARAEVERRAALFPELLEELQEILTWAGTERVPLRSQEIASIARLIDKATGESA